MDTNNFELISNLDKIQNSVFKNYLYNLQTDYTVVDFDEYNTFSHEDGRKINRIKYFANIQALKVERWVYDKKEEIIDRFRNIYSAFANGDNSIALVVKRTVKGTEFYFVLKSDGANKGNEISTGNSASLLRNAIKGNFPGTKINYEAMFSEKGIKEDYFGIGNEKNKAISILTNVASDKSEKHISQGIEKLLNGIVPLRESEEYTVVFLAEPIKHEELLSIKNGYEELASNIFSYSEYQQNEGKNTTETTGTSRSIANTIGTNESISKTHGFNLGINIGASSGTSNGNSEGYGWFKGIIKNAGKVVTKTLSDNVGSNIGGSFGYQYSKTKTEGSSKSDTRTTGTNYCITEGDMNSITTTYRSYPIQSIINRIEKQLQRIEQCEAVGMWRQSTYIMASNSLASKNVANYLLGLLQGEESFVEQAVVNSWHYSNDNSDFNNIKKFIQHFTHPVFINKRDILLTKYKDNIALNDVQCISPTTYISSIELAKTMTFPYKSIQGLSSIECAEFERNVLFKDEYKYKESRMLDLGDISHMHEVEVGNKVTLDIDSLTKHTFVTGSTGSGKSTAVYKILHELKENDIPFLVIEPAKGEYRHEFKEVASVYSTNVNVGALLQINPFKFNYEGILVHEHIDRLIEIFNVCWPMYAAMPAVLKEAIEGAYVDSGWDLNLSINKISNDIFPTFLDVLNQLYIVINQSDFSQEVKSNYIGSLVTRVKSLTNGIFGQIFSSNDMGDNKLFNNYTIIDLSRIGSTETKAMIMGTLVMRMQEYHMTFSEPVNKLKHVTVLEEAHNLLKRTSTEQSSESSNLLGKAVEMVSNAIAEMRTYGEGFIISDQSPGLMDMSVIRNTNTKIILSLPDYTDRELVGRAAGLNDEQIVEVAKLGQGIAVVYQNQWIAPVLCCVNKYDNKEKEQTKLANNLVRKTNLKEIIDKGKSIKLQIAEAILESDIEQIDKLKEEILEYSIHVNIKVLLFEHIYNRKVFSKEEKINIIYDLFYNDNIKKSFKDVERALNLSEDINEANENLYNKLVKSLDIPNEVIESDVLGILNIILFEIKNREDYELANCERFLSFIHSKIG